MIVTAPLSFETRRSSKSYAKVWPPEAVVLPLASKVSPLISSFALYVKDCAPSAARVDVRVSRLPPPSRTYDRAPLKLAPRRSPPMISLVSLDAESYPYVVARPVTSVAVNRCPRPLCVYAQLANGVGALPCRHTIDVTRSMGLS